MAFQQTYEGTPTQLAEQLRSLPGLQKYRMTLISEESVVDSTEGTVLSVGSVSTKTEGSQNTPILDEKSWERVNARRCELIRQKYMEGLDDTEQVELDALEEEATRYLDAVAPLSEYPLGALQAHVDRIKANKQNVP